MEREGRKEGKCVGLLVKVARALEFVNPAELFIGPSMYTLAVFLDSTQSPYFHLPVQQRVGMDVRSPFLTETDHGTRVFDFRLLVGMSESPSDCTLCFGG